MLVVVVMVMMYIGVGGIRDGSVGGVLRRLRNDPGSRFIFSYE